ncbi:hypothetical protein S40293_03785 [Stachybotrys chartarum IBT 40293]|nr:hypothetical protein S40293_03785 [Stachybotrys chartarum IBT 40293]
MGGPKNRARIIKSHDAWIQRIRIQSPALLSLFSCLTGHQWGSGAHTFIRPFRYLVHFHDTFKKELRQRKEENDNQQSPFPAEVYPYILHYKQMIDSAVSSHLRRKKLERAIDKSPTASVVLTQDFVRGKRMGLIIMLHGALGIGKTATAEAVAQSYERPLFPVSCGDLNDSWGVDRRLRFFFRLASQWDCILLFDEVDVLLTACSPDDIERNCLVSIFLRQLESYNGILFLTTNRMAKIDQAIFSRIHLVLHYKRLGKPQIERIFTLNIQRFRQAEKQQAEFSGEQSLAVVENDIMQFAAEHYDSKSSGVEVWNGRQIRNAFTMASALARAEAEEEPPEVQPQLRSSHFKLVEGLTAEYIDFRHQVLGKDDSDLARIKGERDDDYGGFASHANTNSGRSRQTQLQHSLQSGSNSFRVSYVPGGTE